ncbi:MAG TPA: S-layer homology domain-containing protein [Clostridiaceae bacterium]|nr:S-layer homology domain-containing protein [Clostridiaceae bacterium]
MSFGRVDEEMLKWVSELKNNKAYSLRAGNKITAFVTGIVIALSGWVVPVFAAENPEKVYTGIENAAAVLNNIDYTDVKNSNTWAKEAIYETGALGLFKGYGNKQFGRSALLSKEEALALAYRMAGREAEAQKAAEEIDNQRRREDKKKNAVSMWADGYLKLAADDGLISEEDLEDAMNPNQASLGPGAFKRTAPAQRQELAYWFAKTLELEPEYSQERIFNSYMDWKDADPAKIPYIEAILRNGIMNGDDKGYFRPVDAVTREQAAQVIKNAKNIVLPLFGYEKNLGVIEDIKISKDYSSGEPVAIKSLDIRNNSGYLHRINVEYTDSSGDPGRNEQSGKAHNIREKELVVYRNGVVGKSGLLKKGDRIEYITAADNTVRYVKVLSNRNEIKYIAANIIDIDPDNLTMKITEYFSMDYPDLSEAGNSIRFNDESKRFEGAYKYSKGISVTINGRKSGMDKVYPGMDVLLTVDANGTIIALENINIGVSDEESRIVSGIVEDNNPNLGYITLYSKDGAGTRPGAEQNDLLRTYNYFNINRLEVYRNHEIADIDEIEAGDTVFIKLDEDSNVISISAMPNYTAKYALVISKRPSALILQYDDGTQQIIDVDENVLVVRNKKLTNYDSIKDGDRVKVLINETPNFTRIKQITIESGDHYISNIYKGKVSYIDNASDTLVLINAEVFERGQWRRTDHKGATSIKLSNKYNIYFDDKEIKKDVINKYMSDSEAYVAVERGYGGEERAVVISFRKEGDKEVIYDDVISGAEYGKGSVKLSRNYNTITFGQGSIIIKNGRLVTPNSISNDDSVYVVANRDNSSGNFVAGIIEVKESTNTGAVAIYRGRISSIDENKGFTVESFSQLSGFIWVYSNTAKTFNINYGTRILGNDGLISHRDFTPYGEESFIGSVVYIVADGIDAMVISTAPYGIYNAVGDLYEINGGTVGEDGTVIVQPNELKLRNAMIFDTSQYSWASSNDMTVNLLNNTIILKNNRMIKASDLKKGDRLRIVKSESTATGDAYIVIVEN